MKVLFSGHGFFQRSPAVDPVWVDAPGDVSSGLPVFPYQMPSLVAASAGSDLTAWHKTGDAYDDSRIIGVVGGSGGQTLTIQNDDGNIDINSSATITISSSNSQNIDVFSEGDTNIDSGGGVNIYSSNGNDIGIFSNNNVNVSSSNGGDIEVISDNDILVNANEGVYIASKNGEVSDTNIIDFTNIDAIISSPYNLHLNTSNAGGIIHLKTAGTGGNGSIHFDTPLMYNDSSADAAIVVDGSEYRLIDLYPEVELNGAGLNTDYVGIKWHPTVNGDADIKNYFFKANGLINSTGIPEYANRTAALAANEIAGTLYSLPISGDNKVICIV